MRKSSLILGTVAMLAVHSFHAWAGDANENDKSQFNLFNPTPEDLMRDWRTDRSGVSPYTCDAGHFEADLAVVRYGWFSDHPGDVTIRIERWSYAELTLKAGLLNDVDVSLSIAPYQSMTATITDPDGHRLARDTASGFGDLVAHMKWNLWGNDEGPIALALSGHVKIPTASDELGNGNYEGGPALDLAVDLPYEFELRINSFVDFYEDRSGQQQHYFENRIGMSRSMVGPLAGYFVFDAVYDSGSDDWADGILAGLNYRPEKNIEMYADIWFGLRGGVYDYSPSLGVATRF